MVLMTTKSGKLIFGLNILETKKRAGRTPVMRTDHKNTSKIKNK